MSSVQGSRTANSDRPLSERVRVQVTDDPGYGRGCFVFGDQLCEIAALEAERDELEAYLMEALNQLDDFKLVLVDCLKSRRHQLRNVEAERDRLRTALESISEGGYDEAYRIADAALEGGDDGCS